MSARRARSFALFWVALFVLSLGLQYGSVALASLSDSGTVNVVVPDGTQSKSGTTNDGAIVTYIGDSANNQSSGTGVFDPFVRLQGSPTEAGYNTDGTTEFDTKVGTWTHAEKVSDIPVVSIGGKDYWELFNDINETNSTAYISLNKVEVYFTSDPNLTGYPFGSKATAQYAFAGTILIHDVNSGSGRGDLQYDIPLAGVGIPANCDYLDPSCSTYFVLYSEWGTTAAYTDGNNYNSDGGFEEWKTKQYPTLEVVKKTVGGDGTFGFTVAGPTPLALSITTSGGTGSSLNYAVQPGTYAITEGSLPSAEWSLNGATCAVNGGAPTAYTPGSNLTIGSTDHVVCTFTNTFTPPSGYLKLSKVFDPKSSGFSGTFDIVYNCGAGDQTVSLAAGASTTVGPFAAGTSCSVSEPTTPTPPANWTFGSPQIAGSPATITKGDQAAAVSVTVTNSIAPLGINIVKTADPTSLPATGGSVTYTYVVTNTGEAPLSNVTVSDVISGTDTVACSPLSAPVKTGGNQDDVLDLLPETWTYTCTTTITHTTDNTATATGENGGQKVSDSDTAEVVVAAAGPAINIVKTANPTTLPFGGGSVTYTYVVTNTGNVPLSNVTVTDKITGSGVVACSPLSAPVKTGGNQDAVLDLTETWTYTCTKTITQTTSNTATATGQYGESTVTSSDDATVSVGNPPVTPQVGNLQIVKVLNPATSFPGGTFTFSVSCLNNAQPQQSITLTAGQSQGSVTLANLPAGWSCTVTEQTPLVNAGSGWQWVGVPQYAPAQAVTIPANGTATVTVTNFRGQVEAATATPRVTLPPTDSSNDQTGGSSSVNLGLILLVLAGITAVLGFATPVPARIRRRDRRG